MGDDLRPFLVRVQLIGEVLVPELRGDIDQRDLVLQAVSPEPVVVVVTVGVQLLGDPPAGTSTRSHKAR